VITGAQRFGMGARIPEENHEIKFEIADFSRFTRCAPVITGAQHPDLC